MRTFFIVAGEASGDFIGGQLIKALKKIYPTAHFIGVGGPHMQAQGFFSLFPYHELSLFGLIEIIPHIASIFKRLRETARIILENPPTAVITIDSPGFTFRLAKKLRQHSIKTPLIHYVAPQVWAWKPKRAQRVAQLFDHLLCLFPFEPPYFVKEGLSTTFVGHPILETEVLKDNAFRHRFGIPEDSRLITLLPGSRVNEIKRLLPLFQEASLHLKSLWSNQIYLLIPTLAHLKKDLQKAFENFPIPFQILSPKDKYQAFIQSEGAIAASGTVTLELAQWGLPAVIGYRLSPLTYLYAKYFVKVSYISLVNFLLNRAALPELIQQACTPQRISQALLPLLTQTDKRDQLKHAYTQALAQLNPSTNMTPSEAAAAIICHYSRSL